MEKIIMCGATHGSNFGDSLFAYMFKEYVESKSPDIEVVFTKLSEYSKNEMQLTQHRFKDLLKSKALIFISGGYFGQSPNEKGKKVMRRFLTYHKYGLLMLLLRKPIIIVGVGAGPLSNWLLRKVSVHIFNRAKYISVRDIESKNYMLSYGVKNTIHVTSDSAQCIKSDIYNLSSQTPSIFQSEKISGKKIVLVHIIDIDKYTNELYVEKIINTLVDYLVNDDNVGFIITSDTVKETTFIKEVYNLFPRSRTEMYNFRNPIDFLRLIASVDSIITPKLHVGILGATYTKPVLAFAIHPEKTRRYYNQIGYDSRCESLFEVDSPKVKELMTCYLWEPIHIPKDEIKNAQKNFQLIDDFFENNLESI